MISSEGTLITISNKDKVLSAIAPSLECGTETLLKEGFDFTNDICLGVRCCLHDVSPMRQKLNRATYHLICAID